LQDILQVKIKDENDNTNSEEILHEKFFAHMKQWGFNKKIKLIKPRKIRNNYVYLDCSKKTCDFTLTFHLDKTTQVYSLYQYFDEHNHKLDYEFLDYTDLSEEIKTVIKNLLKNGIKDFRTLKFFFTW